MQGLTPQTRRTPSVSSLPRCIRLRGGGGGAGAGNNDYCRPVGRHKTVKATSRSAAAGHSLSTYEEGLEEGELFDRHLTHNECR